MDIIANRRRLWAALEQLGVRGYTHRIGEDYLYKRFGDETELSFGGGTGAVSVRFVLHGSQMSQLDRLHSLIQSTIPLAHGEVLLKKRAGKRASTYIERSSNWTEGGISETARWMYDRWLLFNDVRDQLLRVPVSRP